MKTISKIIIHCSATREGQHVDVDTIRGWHVNDRGWSDIGYHYVIYLDGSVHRGRSDKRQGAHTRGQNKNSLGVCYIGGVERDGKTPKDTRTNAQKKALSKLLLELKNKNCGCTIYGHNDFASKACPSFNATKEYKHISNL